MIDSKVFLFQQIQDILKCPISQQTMTDPVITSDGQTYQRKQIEKWFEQSYKSPVTNLPLRSRQLIPNFIIRTVIQKLWSIIILFKQSKERQEKLIEEKQVLKIKVHQYQLKLAQQNKKNKKIKTILFLVIIALVFFLTISLLVLSSGRDKFQNIEILNEYKKKLQISEMKLSYQLSEVKYLGAKISKCQKQKQNQKRNQLKQNLKILKDDSRTLQNRTMQNKILLNRTIENRTRQNRTLQNRPLQNKPLKNRTSQHETLQNRIFEHQTLQNITFKNQTQQNATLQHDQKSQMLEQLIKIELNKQVEQDKLSKKQAQQFNFDDIFNLGLDENSTVEIKNINNNEKQSKNDEQVENISQLLQKQQQTQDSLQQQGQMPLKDLMKLLQQNQIKKSRCRFHENLSFILLVANLLMAFTITNIFTFQHKLAAKYQDNLTFFLKHMSYVYITFLVVLTIYLGVIYSNGLMFCSSSQSQGSKTYFTALLLFIIIPLICLATCLVIAVILQIVKLKLILPKIENIVAIIFICIGIFSWILVIAGFWLLLC